jgi:hypothetical protein
MILKRHFSPFKIWQYIQGPMLFALLWATFVWALFNNTSVIAGVDFLPTVCRLAGVKVPATHTLDGEAMDDVLRGKSRARTKPLPWEWC